MYPTYPKKGTCQRIIGKWLKKGGMQIILATKICSGHQRHWITGLKWIERRKTLNLIKKICIGC